MTWVCKAAATIANSSKRMRSVNVVSATYEGNIPLSPTVPLGRRTKECNDCRHGNVILLHPDRSALVTLG